jgi:glycosyltransferase involved in cell wall biosynthesis
VRTIEIIIDDFKIGGIQRLALDQAYALNEIGLKATVIVLNSMPGHDVPSFLYAEEDLIKNLKIEIVFFDGSKYQQFKKLKNHVSLSNSELLICHSLRATVFCRLIKSLLKSKCVIVTTLHQILSMSAPIQRVRRVFYSQFADVLFAYSVAVKKDWDYRRKHNPFIWLISSRKAMSICRNGVYLPRINFNKENSTKEINNIKRLVFVNRLTAWKGLPVALKIIEAKEFSDASLLLITPENPEEYLTNLKPDILNRILFSVGKSVSQIEFNSGDIHIYPATYGPSSRYIESISINVLEMACFGVKSFVTKGGVETWPELVKSGIIYEVSWLDVPSVIRTMLENGLDLEASEVERARQLIDIKKNLEQIFHSSGLAEFFPTQPK